MTKVTTSWQTNMLPKHYISSYKQQGWTLKNWLTEFENCNNYCNGCFIFFRLSISAFFAITVLFTSEGSEVMVIICSILVARVWYHSEQKLACENIRFSSLFAAGGRRNGKGSEVFYLGCQGLKDGHTNKTFGEPFGLPNILAGVPGPPSWWRKLINQWAVSWSLKINQIIF